MIFCTKMYEKSRLYWGTKIVLVVFQLGDALRHFYVHIRMRILLNLEHKNSIFLENILLIVFL